jgi:hypothetical protein
MNLEEVWKNLEFEDIRISVGSISVGNSLQNKLNKSFKKGTIYWPCAHSEKICKNFPPC